jgi:glycopeptide antibiotics resistance protein
MDINRKITKYLFFFFVFFVIYNTLIPFRFDSGWQDLGTEVSQLEWRPFSSEKGEISLTDIVGNIILFIPFGFLLYMRLYNGGSQHPILPILWSVISSAALSFSVEFAQ